MKANCALVLALSSTLILAGCGDNEESSQSSDKPHLVQAIQSSGSKSGVFASVYTGRSKQALTRTDRPSSPLGAYVSMYLAQEHILLTLSALEGIDVQIRLARAQEQDQDETYALLQEYGTVLQVDLIDMLNRSSDRDKSLNRYVSSLVAMNNRVEEKITELKEKIKSIDGERKEQKKKVRDIERKIRRAMKDENYAAAGPAQEELVEKEAVLAKTESRKKSTKKVMGVAKDLLEIGEERAEAISKNREILIVGLQVI